MSQPNINFAIGFIPSFAPMSLWTSFMWGRGNSNEKEPSHVTNSQTIQKSSDSTDTKSLSINTWDGPSDPDEEIKELAQYKNEYEKIEGLKFSKNGIISYIDSMLEKE